MQVRVIAHGCFDSAGDPLAFRVEWCETYAHNRDLSWIDCGTCDDFDACGTYFNKDAWVAAAEGEVTLAVKKGRGGAVELMLARKGNATDTASGAKRIQLDGQFLAGPCVYCIAKVIGTLAGGDLLDSWALVATTMLPGRALPLTVEDFIVMTCCWEVQHGVYPCAGVRTLIGAMATQDLALTTLRGYGHFGIAVQRVGLRRHFSLAECVGRAMAYIKACAIASQAANDVSAAAVSRPAPAIFDTDLGVALALCSLFATCSPD